MRRSRPDDVRPPPADRRMFASSPGPRLRRSVLTLAIALFAQACATAGTTAPSPPAKSLGPETQADRETVERLRRETPSRIAEQAERLWRLWTTGEEGAAPACAGEPAGVASAQGSQQDEAGDASVPARVREPAAPRVDADPAAGAGCPADPTVDDVLSLARVRAASKDAAERRALRLLEAHLVGGLVADATAPLRDREGAIEVGAKLEFDGESHAFRELGSLLAREPDHDRRVRIAGAASRPLRELDEVAAESERRIAALANRLGYRDAAGLRALSLPLPIARLQALAADFLQATDDPYRLALSEAARRELGLSPEELHRADLPALFAGVLFDVRYPREGGREAMKQTFSALGVDLDAVRIDDVPRPHRLARPACFPVAPPHDVRLALPPVPATDWRPSFREAACALQAANAAPDRFEFTQLGHPGASAGLAQPAADLAEAPAWLRKHTRLTEAEIDAQLAGAALKRLFVARRAAGKILVASGRDYRASMERALGVPISSTDGARWLASREGGDSPRDLVGWMVGAMATARLEELHGEAWWERREAGEALVALWREGGRLDPDGLARLLGGDRLEAGPLAARLVVRLAPLLRAPPPGRPPAPPPAKETPPPPESDQSPSISLFVR